MDENLNNELTAPSNSSANISNIALPNGDVAYTNTANSTNSASKMFLIGATTQAAAPTTNSNSAVYATAGNLHATTICIAETATMQYNSTNKCIDFIFA